MQLKLVRTIRKFALNVFFLYKVYKHLFIHRVCCDLWLYYFLIDIAIVISAGPNKVIRQPYRGDKQVACRVNTRILKG